MLYYWLLCALGIQPLTRQQFSIVTKSRGFRKQWPPNPTFRSSCLCSPSQKYIYMSGGNTENAKDLSSLVSLLFPPLVTGTGRRKFRGPAESTLACDAKLLGAAQKPESFTERLDTQNGQRKGGFRWLSGWKHPNRRGHMFKCTCSDSEPASRF